MSVTDILNTDVDVLGARVRGAVDWWLDEMRAMLAPVLARNWRGQDTPTAVRQKDGGYLLIGRDGARARHASFEKIAAAVMLPDDAVLVHTFPAPNMPERDIPRWIALDLDRLTPFPVDAVYQDIRVLPSSTPTERSRVRLAVTPRAEADRALQEAQAAGLTVTGLLAPVDGPEPPDFLPAMRAAGVGRTSSRRTAWAWAAVGLLVLLNIGAAIWRDSHEVARLQATVASQRPVVDYVRRLRREAQTSRALAGQRAAELAAGDPLRVLDALSRAMPDDAYVQRLAWDGAAVHIAGVRSNNVDLLAALRREPMLANVRNANPDAIGDAGFDIVAEVRKPPSSVVTPAP